MRTTWKPSSKKTKLTFLLTLLFSTLMFSSPSYGEWTKVIRSVEGDDHYVDFERIRKHGGYVYFWTMMDFLKPQHGKYFSAQGYNQGDCKLFRHKNLTVAFFGGPMGKGSRRDFEVTGKYANWRYASPESIQETLLKRVCGQ